MSRYGASPASPLVDRPVGVHAQGMDSLEHGILMYRSDSNELLFHTAGGATTVADSTAERHLLGAMDNLAADGWEVLGPATLRESQGQVTTSYLLRRAVKGSQPVQMPSRLY